MFPQYVFPLRSLFPLLSPNLGVLLALLIFDCEAVIGVIGISWSRRSSSSASSSSLFSSALIFVGNGVPLLFPIDRTVRGPGVAKFVSSVYEHKLSFFWFNFHLPHNSQIHNEQRVQIISEMTLRCVHNRASRFSRLGTETPRLSVWVSPRNRTRYRNSCIRSLGIGLGTETQIISLRIGIDIKWGHIFFSILTPFLWVF